MNKFASLRIGKEEILKSNHKYGSFNECSILEIMEYTDNFIGLTIGQVNEKCGSKELLNICGIIDKKKKFKGRSKKEEMINFIDEYIKNTYNLMKKKATLFNNEEENKTNRHHLKLRREIVSKFKTLSIIYGITVFTVSSSNGLIKYNLKPEQQLKAVDEIAEID